MKKKEMKLLSLEEITDKHVGKKGSIARKTFEDELRADLIGEAIKQARKERNLTQEELGQLIGVQKAQISKLEKSFTDVRLETILKVFRALNAQVSFNVKLLDQNINFA